ncbi:FAD/NAD(P)-binding protein [Leifsonia sp. ZF2019]|uniref:FAD/NAD(P)-binding protein n=1 Tax=Leifsonia sp. ZF2019 TaxID=2781978 RepID=UPI001CBA9B4E|nr:FAD/NAD(P)-binding protein [Leifsonia sp. ZF2019]UAJ81082.1 FAD/NAD(P)-binding protein [Leifsonia sp. ZF2019]
MPSSAPTARPDSVALVGAGPRAAGWLERFAAARSVRAHRRPITVHLVDPFPPGPGRIWRREQSPLLKLNSMVEDVTMFTDDSCTIEGPVRPGPSLLEWVEGVRSGAIADAHVDDPVVAAELGALRRGDFPTRRLQSHYLDWFLRRAIAALDDDVTLVLHRDRVTAVREAGAAQEVLLAGGGSLHVGAVVYALGHAGSEPSGEAAELAAFAARHGLDYLAPAFTADADLGAFGAGRTVAVRGFGLAAVDLVVLLTEGRGGRFDRDPSGDLRYTPSGLEPRLLIGSRRGVPYRSKISSALVGEPPALRHLTPAVVERLAASSGHLDFREDVWPLIARELVHGYYRELFTGHPERVRLDWAVFAARLDETGPEGAAYDALVSGALRHPDDELHLDRFDRPLAGLRFTSPDDLQTWMREHLRTDLQHRTSPDHSATLGLFTALLHALFALAPHLAGDLWTEESRRRDVVGWWPGYFSYVASGPPGHRLEELIALSEAGIVHFAGADIRVVPDERTGRFRVGSASVTGETAVSALIDAWLPAATAESSDDPALRDLVTSGAGSVRHGEVRVAAADARVLRPDGVPHPARWAIGPFTTAPFAGAFSRPNTNALAFRENDRVAQAVLDALGGGPDPATTPSSRRSAPGTPGSAPAAERRTAEPEALPRR